MKVLRLIILGLPLFGGLEGNKAMAYDAGNLPFCLVDDYNNRTCYYWNFSACAAAAQTTPNTHCERK